MPFDQNRQGQGAYESPEEKGARELKESKRVWNENIELDRFDLMGEWDNHRRQLLEGPGPPPPPPALENPWRGLKTGMMPMPKWTGPPDIAPGFPDPDRSLGVSRESMDPKNFPLQSILEPQYPAPPPPHVPRDPNPFRPRQ
tara:strand:+ start:413 stop:838 length:426 start_codon:yes stop_codon:yes gene_type:complete